MRNSDVQDPRNDQDYDTFEYGTEPLPNDKTWIKKKSEESDGTTKVQ